MRPLDPACWPEVRRLLGELGEQGRDDAVRIAGLEQQPGQQLGRLGPIGPVGVQVPRVLKALHGAVPVARTQVRAGQIEQLSRGRGTLGRRGLDLGLGEGQVAPRLAGQLLGVRVPEVPQVHDIRGEPDPPRAVHAPGPGHLELLVHPAVPAHRGPPGDPELCRGVRLPSGPVEVDQVCLLYTSDAADE